MSEMMIILMAIGFVITGIVGWAAGYITGTDQGYKRGWEACQRDMMSQASDINSESFIRVRRYMRPCPEVKDR